MKTVLIISPTPIGKQMAGPSIRYWEVACQLAKENKVILLAPKYIELSDDRLILDLLNIRSICKYINRSDLIIIQGMTLWKYPLIKYFSKPIAVDLYDPMHLENLEVYKENRFIDRLLYKTTTMMICEQLSRGDFFFCASEKQKDYWLGMMTSIGRIDVRTYNKLDRNINKLIGVVPFGIPDDEPTKGKISIREKFTRIRKEDKIIVWGGGIWDWLDPETLVIAMNIVKSKRDDIKCLFLGVKPPNSKESRKLKSLKQLIEKLELEDTVFLNDWVDYNERSYYLLEASVGISLHDDHLETRFSYRTRILDYIWCNIPIISSRGDVFADIIEKENLGCTVPVKDDVAIAEAILSLVDKKNIPIPKDKYRWSYSINDLRKYCSSPYLTSNRIDVQKEIKWMFWRLVYYSTRIINKIKRNVV